MLNSSETPGIVKKAFVIANNHTQIETNFNECCELGYIQSMLTD